MSETRQTPSTLVKVLAALVFLGLGFGIYLMAKPKSVPEYRVTSAVGVEMSVEVDAYDSGDAEDIATKLYVDNGTTLTHVYCAPSHTLMGTAKRTATGFGVVEPANVACP